MLDVGFTTLSPSVDEGAGSVTLVLALSGIIEATQADIWVTMDVTNGPLAIGELQCCNYNIVSVAQWQLKV